MPKCNDSTCFCAVRGGVGVTVTGSGAPSAPYVVAIDQAGRLSVVDSTTIDLSLAGQGTTDDPAILTAALTAHLGDLIDVAKSSPSTGQVLAWTGTQWAPVPPTTAAVGSVAVSQGITGDGSAGAPLTAVADPNGGLVVGALGSALSAATLQRLANLEARFPVNYLRVERSDTLQVPSNSWAIPLSYNLGVTKVVGSRMSYAGGVITVLDAGVYAWEATATWPGHNAQTNMRPPSVGCSLQQNAAFVKSGAVTTTFPGEFTGSSRISYSGSVSAGANDALRLAFFSWNINGDTITMTPEQFTVHRIG